MLVNHDRQLVFPSGEDSASPDDNGLEVMQLAGDMSLETYPVVTGCGLRVVAGTESELSALEQWCCRGAEP